MVRGGVGWLMHICDSVICDEECVLNWGVVGCDGISGLAGISMTTVMGIVVRCVGIAWVASLDVVM